MDLFPSTRFRVFVKLDSRNRAIYVEFDSVAASQIPLRRRQHNFKIRSCTNSIAEQVLGLAKVRVEDNKAKLQHAGNRLLHVARHKKNP
jgi:hypothetical protein